MKFITVELHTAAIERTKKSESDDTPDVGETSCTTPTAGLDPSQELASQSDHMDKNSVRDRSAKRLPKGEEFFRLFLHLGSYSVPVLIPPTMTQRPRANTVSGTANSNSNGNENNSSARMDAPLVFDDRRECRFFNKRERAEVQSLIYTHSQNGLLCFRIKEILLASDTRALQVWLQEGVHTTIPSYGLL